MTGCYFDSSVLMQPCRGGRAALPRWRQGPSCPAGRGKIAGPGPRNSERRALVGERLAGRGETGWMARTQGGANRSVAGCHVRFRARPRTTPEVVSKMGYRPFPTVSHGAWTPGKAPPRRTGVPACGFLRPLPDAPYRPAPSQFVSAGFCDLWPWRMYDNLDQPLSLGADRHEDFTTAAAMDYAGPGATKMLHFRRQGPSCPAGRGKIAGPGPRNSERRAPAGERLWGRGETGWMARTQGGREPQRGWMPREDSRPTEDNARSGLKNGEPAFPDRLAWGLDTRKSPTAQDRSACLRLFETTSRR